MVTHSAVRENGPERNFVKWSCSHLNNCNNSHHPPQSHRKDTFNNVVIVNKYSYRDVGVNCGRVRERST